MEANDVKAMREALVRTDLFLSALGKWLKVNDEGQEYALAAGVIHTLVERALAKLPRQCDVGTAEEQAERFILFCLQNSFRGVCNNSCRFANVNRRLGWQEIGQARCFPFWAQMPYEGGEER